MSRNKNEKVRAKFKKNRRNFEERSSESSNEGSNIVFGIAPVFELLNARSRHVEKIFIAEGKRHKRIGKILSLAESQKIRFQMVSRQEIESFADHGANHQGVVAITAAAGYYKADDLFEEIIEKKNSLSLILDGVEDPHNLGAILRSAECAGADGIFIPERRAAGLTETVVKSSAGASEYVKLAKVKNINRLIDKLKENNVWVIGASGDSEMEYDEWDWKESCALVLGSEGKGISRLTAEKCDVLVKIPMYGKIGSLNVSVAAGVLLFEAVRQRLERSDK